MEKKYSPVALASMDADKGLPTDIYVKIGEKYIRFKPKGEPLTCEKANYFLSKGTNCVYVQDSGIKVFKHWEEECHQEQVNSDVEKVGEEFRELAEDNQKVKQSLSKAFAEDELTEESFQDINDQAENLIEKAKENPLACKAMGKLLKHNKSLVDHCQNVANLSVYLALSLGKAHGAVLENIYMGALLHDFGKVKIPPKVLEEGPSSAAYARHIEFHCQHGLKLMSKVESVADPVLTIIREHHEHFDGSGYPNKKEGKDTYGLSKIVALANAFDNMVTEDKTSKRKIDNVYKRALKVLERNTPKHFDPEILEPALKAIKELYNQ